MKQKWMDKYRKLEADNRHLRDMVDKLKADKKRLKEKIGIVCNGIPAPEFEGVDIIAASLKIKLNLFESKNAYLYGWEAAILECGEILSKS